jgi:hypothetical protein
VFDGDRECACGGDHFGAIVRAAIAQGFVMARVKKQVGDLASIAEKRDRLKAELARLDEAERAVIDAERDAGRGALLAALGRVKIGPMDRKQAAAIAHAIGTIPVVELIGKLAAE